MTDYQNEVVVTALNEYAGWFDDHDKNDRASLDAIYQALNAKNPLEHAITNDALVDYAESLQAVVDDNFYQKDQRHHAHYDFGVVNDLLTH